MNRTQALADLSHDLTERVDSLSERQRLALQLRSRGLSCKEAAAQMGIGRDAFKDLCYRARLKLDASNMPEAAAMLTQAENSQLRLAIHRVRETLRQAPQQHGRLTARVLCLLDGAVRT